jgi:hypothetical protein
MGVYWTCVACGAPNPAAADVCSPCGRPFAAGLADTGSGRDLTRALGRLRGALIVLREIVVLNVLFLLWRVVGHYALVRQAGADHHGLDVWRLERTLRLPSERALQRTVLPHPDLVRAADALYAYAHAPTLALVLLWLLLRHRAAYRRWRNRTVVFTALALLIQLFPVAPPRLLPSLGVVDTARTDGLSVYGGAGHGLADQLASMPSIHVGWALIVAAAVIGSAQGRPRWLTAGYPLLITLDVVVTGNHFWLDGVAAALLLGALVATDRALASRRAGRRASPGVPAPRRPMSASTPAGRP